MKRIVTLLLAFTLVFSTCTLSYAAENETTDSKAETATIVFNKIILKDDNGNERLLKLTIKGVVGVQLDDCRVYYEDYQHSYLDTYYGDETYFTYDEDKQEEIWNGKGELIKNGIDIIPVIQGAEVLLEVIDGKDDLDFYPGYFCFINDEKTVISQGMGQGGFLGTGTALVFDKLSVGTFDEFPIYLNNKPVGIMVVDPKTYPQPTKEKIEAVKTELGITDSSVIKEDTTKEEENVKEEEPKKDTEAVPGLNNFEQVNEYTPDTFNDVEDGIWYADSVRNCYELGIMNGKGDNQFAPKGSISVAEAIAMASRTNKIYAGLGSEIEKTGDTWYDGFVKYAVENNIIKEDQFDDYTRKITKAELSYLFAKSVPEEEFTAIQLYLLPDVDDDTDYSSEIYLLFNAGVVTGSDENATFHPTNNITRAEASAIINRVINPDSRKAL
ncbi:S-layer homology domain-containing protein [Vallitalea maricola]|uniref:Uncharacterized protein n=1 Tax=Vallitalea maricola TaxID=3074433 RepID=A0ACB5UH02_9FIRM|nr:hypothetical protein AN2V17_09750 [Vallitalea sp. AN17-2]